MSPLRRFVLSALLWLPACFLLWMLLDSVVVWPAGFVAGLVLPALMPQAIADVVQLGATLEVETRLLTTAGAGDQVGALLLTVSPLIYAWCLPLFAGLVLATPLSGRQTARQFAIGLPLLWAVVCWGTVFDVLKLLAFDAGPLGAAAVQQAGFGADAVALGYQFGYLILPAVLPVALWMVLNREFLEDLVGWREPNPVGPGPSEPAPRATADRETP